VTLTLIDTPGFGDFVNNDNCWETITKFIDDQNEAFMRQESQINRSNIIDMRVHCALYFIPPTGKSLRSIDVETMKRLSGRVNLIPVIAKADTLSPEVLSSFKARVREGIATNEISIYSCPLESDDENSKKRNIEIMSTVPFSIVSGDYVVKKDGQKVIGRKYNWGVVEVENDAHCDFRKLRSLLIRTHMHDLIETTVEIFYENYRAKRLENPSHYADDASLKK
jgi:cell division control protein 12